MDIIIRKYSDNDLGAMTKIWNHIVKEGQYFPQENGLSLNYSHLRLCLEVGDS